MKQLVGSICDPEGLRRHTFFTVNDTNVKYHRNSLVVFPVSWQITHMALGIPPVSVRGLEQR